MVESFRLYLYKILTKSMVFSRIREFIREEWRLEKAKAIVQYFYYFSAFWVILSFSTTFIPEIGRTGIDLTPVWALAWAPLFTPEQVITLVMLFFVMSVFVGILLYERWWGRVLVFLGFLEYVALQFSLGHGSIMEWYPWLYTTFLFIFLPNIFKKGKALLEEHKKFLLVLWGAQALFLSTYTLSGLHKVIVGIDQLAQGQLHSFHPLAFAQQLAYLAPKYQSNVSIFGSFFIDHPYLGWPIYLVVIYVQVFAVWTAIRTSLQKIWAILLILFHLGSAITFHIIFLPEVLLLFLLFFDSPFLIQKEVGVKGLLLDFPIFGWAISKVDKILRR